MQSLFIAKMCYKFFSYLQDNKFLQYSYKTCLEVVANIFHPQYSGSCWLHALDMTGVSKQVKLRMLQPVLTVSTCIVQLVHRCVLMLTVPLLSTLSPSVWQPAAHWTNWTIIVGHVLSLHDAVVSPALGSSRRPCEHSEMSGRKRS